MAHKEHGYRQNKAIGRAGIQAEWRYRQSGDTGRAGLKKQVWKRIPISIIGINSHERKSDILTKISLTEIPL